MFRSTCGRKPVRGRRLCGSPAWRIRVETNSEEVARDVRPRSGCIEWQWSDGDEVTHLDIWGSPPRGDQREATSLQYVIDRRERTILVRHSGDDEAGCIDLLSRWVLPEVSRTERDLLPLHACSVQTASGAVLILGESGRGKSTLTAALLDSGASLICDEPVCVNAQGAWPGPSALRLDPAVALELLGTTGPLDYAGKAQLRADVDATQARPVAALVVLAPRRVSGPLLQWERMRPTMALAALMKSRYVRITVRVAEDMPRAASVAAAFPVLSVSLRDDRGLAKQAAAELLGVIHTL